MGKKQGKNAGEKSAREKGAPAETRKDAGSNERAESKDKNPPRTTSHGWLTTPKFGSSTSGGGEIEPGPERD